jgi:hypothetical protein
MAGLKHKTAPSGRTLTEFAHALNENYDCCYPSCALRRALQKHRARRSAEIELSNDETQVTQHLRADIPFQSEEQFTDPKWAVTRQAHAAQPKPGLGPEAAAHLHREWGGEFAMRKYYATAAARMLAERFGNDVGQFLLLADKANPDEVIDLLRESVACRHEASAARRQPKSHDEPPLPFMDSEESIGASVHHC